MISVKLLNGDFAGETKDIKPTCDPVDFLGNLCRLGWKWEIDYSKADKDEFQRWAESDINFRCIRSLEDGRQVRFLGKVYQGRESILRLCDDICSAGKKIGILCDDDYGVVIATG